MRNRKLLFVCMLAAVLVCGSALAFAARRISIVLPPVTHGPRAEGYYGRGVTYYASGEYEQAIADFTQAIGMDPDFVEAYYDRAIAHRNLGDYEQAIADLSAKSLHFGASLAEIFDPAHTERGEAACFIWVYPTIPRKDSPGAAL